MTLTLRRLRWSRGLPAVTLLAVASIAQAQGAPSRADAASARPNPMDAQARVPAVTYQSPLANYRRLGDDKPVPWKQANETVNRIGGWRSYLREAQQPEPAASVPGPPRAPASGTTPGATPAPGGHHKH